MPNHFQDSSAAVFGHSIAANPILIIFIDFQWNAEDCRRMLIFLLLPSAMACTKQYSYVSMTSNVSGDAYGDWRSNGTEDEHTGREQT